MATNKPTGDNARKGQLKTSLAGQQTFTKRSKVSGRFVDQKKAPAKKKFKGVRMEK